MVFIKANLPTSVAQMDARPIGDHEVSGSNPAWSALSAGSLPLIQEAAANFRRKQMCTILVR